MLVSTLDGFAVTVPRPVAMKCKTLMHAPEDGQMALPLVTSECMLRVVEYYSATTTQQREVITSLAPPDLVHLAEAANFLGATHLLEDVCDALANLLQQCKKPHEMRDLLMLPIDTMGEDTHAAQAEFAWALP